jgi:DNA-binding MarR family transcriptional regulator
MDFFILAAVARGGLHSLYELRKGVGLQPGAIHPALRRLEGEGFLARSPQEKRRRRLMTVTPKGEQFLDTGWRNSVRHYPEPESILRAATVAILMGDRAFATNYLWSVASGYEQELPKPAAWDRKKLSPIEWNGLMRSSWEVARRQSAANVFRDIARKLVESETTS